MRVANLRPLCHLSVPLARLYHSYSLSIISLRHYSLSIIVRPLYSLSIIFLLAQHHFPALQAVTIAIITVDAFRHYSLATEYTTNGGARITRTFDAIIAAQDLMLAAKGWRPFPNASDEVAARRAILNNMTTFQELHRSMYAFAQGTPVEESYLRRVVTTKVFGTSDAGPTGAVRILNLFEAALTFSTVLKQIAALPLGNLSSDAQAEIRYVHANLMPGGNVHEETHHSMGQGFSMSLGSKASLANTQTIVFIAMMSLLLVLALLVFFPILVAVERAKDAIVVQILGLPPAVRRLLFVQSVRRARTLRRQYLSQDDEEDEDDSDGDEAEAAAGGGAGGGEDGEGGDGEGGPSDSDGVDKGRRGGAPPIFVVGGDDSGGDGSGGGELALADSDAAEGDIDWGAVMAEAAATPNARSRSRGGSSGGSRLGAFASSRSAGTARAGSAGRGRSSAAIAPAPGGGAAAGGSVRAGPRSPGRSGAGRASSAHLSRQRRRPFRKSWRSFLALVARFITPLLALAVFFAVIFGASMAQLDATLALSSAAMAANARAACSRELIMDLRRLVAQQEPREFVQENYNGLVDVGDCMTYNVELLAFGTPEGPSKGNYVPHTPPLESGKTDLLSSETSAALAAAFFSDACPFIAQSSFRPVGVSSADFLARCRAFSSGILQEGISAVVAEYISRMMLLADERLRARTGSNFGSAAGLLLPKESYNYTEDLGVCGSAKAAGLPPPGEECNAAAAFGEEEVLTPLEPPPVPNLKLWRGDFQWDVDGVTPVDDGSLAFNISDPDVAPYSLGDAIASANMLWLEEADKLYVTPALFAAASVYSQATIDGIASFNSFVIIFTAAYMGVYVMLMILVYIPQVRVTSQDITSRRAMLLYLPAEIVSRQKAIKALVQSILAADSERAGFGVPSASLGGGQTIASVGRAASSSSGGGTGEDSAAARMSDDAGALLTRTRSFHGEPSKTRVTVNDV